MTSLVYAVDVIGVTPVIETNIQDRIAGQMWNIHYAHGQLGYADLWSYMSNAKIGVCTPDEITKVGARYWMYINLKGQGHRAVGVDFHQAFYDTGVTHS